MKWAALFSVMIFLFAFTFASAQAQNQPVVKITSIQGAVYWKHSKGDPGRRLNPKHDLEKPVYAKEYVRCDKGGKLVLEWITDKHTQDITGSPVWHQINPVKISGDNGENGFEAGRRGGRSRGMNPRIHKEKVDCHEPVAVGKR